MSVIHTWREIGFLQFYNVIYKERNFSVLGVIMDILDWHPRHHLAKDHRNQKAFFFFFLIENPHSMP